MERIDIPGAAQPEGHYSPAIKSGNFIFISGQVGIDTFTGEMAEGGIVAQTQKTLENVQLVLESAGSSIDKIVKMNIFVTNIAYWDEVNAIYREFFGQRKPARIIIPISDLGDGLLIEIDAIAEA